MQDMIENGSVAFIIDGKLPSFLRPGKKDYIQVTNPK